MARRQHYYFKWKDLKYATGPWPHFRVTVNAPRKDGRRAWSMQYLYADGSECGGVTASGLLEREGHTRIHWTAQHPNRCDVASGSLHASSGMQRALIRALAAIGFTEAVRCKRDGTKY